MLALQAAEGDEEGRPKERPEGEKQRRGDEVGPVPVLVDEQPSHHLPPDPAQRRQMTTKGRRRMAPSQQWLGQCLHIHGVQSEGNRRAHGGRGSLRAVGF